MSGMRHTGVLAPLLPLLAALAVGEAPLFPAGELPAAPAVGLVLAGLLPLAPGEPPLAAGEAPLTPGEAPTAPVARDDIRTHCNCQSWQVWPLCHTPSAMIVQSEQWLSKAIC